MKKVFVFGSLNMDYSLVMDRLPESGETIESKNMLVSPGGKGANQAVACAKQGGNVYMLGSVGSDENGKQLVNGLTSNGVDTSGIAKVKNITSGTAVIFVANCDNRIVTNAGANSIHNVDQIKQFLELNASSQDILLLQYEVPKSNVEDVAEYAKKLGMYVILNPAPADIVSSKLYKNIDLLVVNEVEYRTIFKKRFKCSAVNKEAKSTEMRPSVVVTVGDRGSYYIGGGEVKAFNAIKVKAVDTTAAGDTYIGTMAACLSKGLSIEQSINMATAASALAVTKCGAQVSMPTYTETLQLLSK